MELVLGPLLSLGGADNAPAALTDAVLMARYAGGDMAAFEQLYRRHRGPLYRYIVRFSPARADADEIFQEVWMAVIKGRERYAPAARFATFLFSIAHRRIADLYRLAARRRALCGLCCTPSATSVSKRSPRLQACLTKPLRAVRAPPPMLAPMGRASIWALTVNRQRR